MKGSRRTNPSHNGGPHRADTKFPAEAGYHQCRLNADGGYQVRRGNRTDFDLNIAYANAY